MNQLALDADWQERALAMCKFIGHCCSAKLGTERIVGTLGSDAAALCRRARCVSQREGVQSAGALGSDAATLCRKARCVSQRDSVKSSHGNAESTTGRCAPMCAEATCVFHIDRLR